MTKQLVLCVAAWITVSSGLSPAQIASPVDQDQGLSCRTGQLPASWSFVNPPGEIEHNEAVFDNLGLASVNFNFRNLLSAPLEALALVLEYLDGRGTVIERVPVAAMTEEAQIIFTRPSLLRARSVGQRLCRLARQYW
jgi:hypothetical protein